MQINATLDGLEDVLVRAAQEGAQRALEAQTQSDALLTVEGAADYLSSSPAAVRALVRRRQVPFMKLPTGGIRFDRHELDAWARSEVGG